MAFHCHVNHLKGCSHERFKHWSQLLLLKCPKGIHYISEKNTAYCHWTIAIHQVSLVNTCKASYGTYGTYRISLRVSTKQPRLFQLVAPSCKKSPPDHCQWTPPQGQSGSTQRRSILTDWHQAVRVWSLCFHQLYTKNNFHSVDILNISIHKHVQCSFRHAELDSVHLLPELQESEALYLSNIQSNN